MSWKLGSASRSSSTPSSSSRMISQLASTCLTQGKRSSGRNCSSPTSERLPMKRSTGAKMRSPIRIVHWTTRFHIRRLILRCLAQSRQLGRLGELLQRALLQLRGSLGGEPEALADRGERLRLLAASAEAQGENLALGVGQLRDRAVHDALALVLVGYFLGGLLLGRQQVAQRGIAVFADLLVEADERVALVAHFFDLLELQARLLRELLVGGLAPEAHRELALHAPDLARALGHVHGQANGAPGVLKAALDGLADPQGCVGGEAKALAPVELLARADQSEHALLHQISQRQALVLVAPRIGGHQAQV